jgi:O-antigen/teichoic acid export membrane protein
MAPIYDGVAPIGWFEKHRLRARYWLRTKLGIDKPIAFTILGRAWASSAGLVTVALIARFLSPAEQGYYYTFGSLVALQIVFELGFSFVILQMASHERAHLEIAPNGTLTGNPAAHARLASVLQKAVRWYSSAAAVLAVFLLLAGFRFFSRHQQTGVNVHWHLPWIVAAVAAAITFQIDPILSFMEGCGFVANVARVRLGQAAAGSLLAWTVLVFHHGLFAPSLVILGNAFVALLWLSRHRYLLLSLLRHPTHGHRIHWIQEVWPFQWRIAVSWLCGYFIFQLYNPVLFAFRGAVVAGQMGMSLSLASALQSVAVSWINTKAAPFGSLIARRDFERLDRTFFQSLRQSIGVCAFGALTVWSGVVYINYAHIKFAHRLLDPISMAILLTTVLLNVVIFGEATYLRAHKQEKFLLNSVIGAILMAASTWFLGKEYGARGVVTGSLLVGLFMGLPLATYVFVKYRRLWHAS